MGCALGYLGDTEIHDLHLPVFPYEDVAGLHVPVDDSRLMGRFESLGGGYENIEGLLQGEGALLTDQLAKGTPLHVLHGEEGQLALLPDRVDRADRRMVKPGRGLGLSLKTLDEGGIFRQLRPENLQGHGSVEAHLMSLVDRGHPPTPQE